MVRLLTVITLISLFPLHSLAKIEVATYRFPPYSMIEQGEQIGMITEALQVITKDTPLSSLEINEYPLKRALSLISKHDVDMMYPYVKQSQRDIDYTLIGPITYYRLGLFVNKDYVLKPSLDNLGKFTVGVERGSLAAGIAKEQKADVQISNSSKFALKKLLSNRFDVWMTGEDVGYYVSTMNGARDAIREIKTQVTYPIYIALSKKLSPEQTQMIQKQFDTLNESSYFENLSKVYDERMQIFMEANS